MQHGAELRLRPSSRRGRKAVLLRLCALFEGNDPAVEVRRLKMEDGGF